MKKHRIVSIVILAFIMVFVFLFAACTSKDKGNECTNHQYTEETIVDPTCTETGTLKKTCTVCGHTETNSIPALGHDFGGWEVVREASVTQNGLSHRICSRCQAEETSEITHEHTFTEKVIKQTYLAEEATCCSFPKYYYSCACGEKSIYTFEDTNAEKAEHTYQKDTKRSVEATCTTKGCTISVCTVCQNEKIDEVKTLQHFFGAWETLTKASCGVKGVKVKTCAHCKQKEIQETAALEHSYNVASATCTTAKKCSNCGTIAEPALGHNYIKDNSKTKLVSCTVDGSETYTCSNCTASYTTVTEVAKGHKSNGTWVNGEREQISGCSYKITSTSNCSVCTAAMKKEETISIHTYDISITTVALCNQDGEKILQCKYCPAKTTETYKDENAHTWGTPTEKDGITTYSCANCQKTKTTLSYTGEKSATVDSTALKKAGSIDLKGASITFGDDAQGSLVGEVEITADTKDPKDISLPATVQLKEDAKIFDLTLSADGEAVHSLGGKVEVSVEYELSDGENPENIAILYIDGNGGVETIKATYRDGRAFFETDHFSYYSVTLLTATERCALYGHVDTDKTIDKTCLKDGYILHTCKRCGRTEFEVTDVLKATGHDTDTTTNAATCSKDGFSTIKCKNCTYVSKKILPATGHNWNQTEYVAATCQASGKTTYCCQNKDCTESYYVTEAQLPHTFSDVVTDPTCSTAGYTTHTCSACQFAYVSDRKVALGHSYINTTVAATCTADGYDEHVCERCQDTYQDNIVPKHHVFDIDVPTCGRGQICTICKAEGEKATGNHTLVNGICIYCGAGCDHTFVKTVVNPTCGEDGYTKNKCSKCDYSYIEDRVGKTDTHRFVDGICTVCGKSEPVSINYYETFIKSFVNQQVTFTINHANLKDSSSNAYDYCAMEMMADGLSISLYLGEDNKLTGKVAGEGSYIDDNEKMTFGLEGVIEDGKVYAAVATSIASATSIYCVMDIKGLINDLLKSELDIEDAYTVLEDGFVWVKENVLPEVEDIADTNSDLISLVTEAIVSFVFDVKDIKGGNKTLTLSLERGIDVYEMLYNESIKTVFDTLFGNYFTYDEVRGIATDAFDWTVNDILTFIEDKGIDIDRLVGALIDVFNDVKGNEIFADMGIVGIADINLDNYVEDLGEIFDQVSGATTMKDFILSVLHSEIYRSYTVTKIMKEFFGIEPETIDDIKESINKELEMVGNRVLLKEVIGDGEDGKESFDRLLDFMENIQDGINISFTTDKTGVIISGILDLDLDLDVIDTSFSMQSEILTGQKATIQDVSVIADAKKYVMTEQTLKAILDANNTAEGVYENSKLVSVKVYEERNVGHWYYYGDGGYGYLPVRQVMSYTVSLESSLQIVCVGCKDSCRYEVLSFFNDEDKYLVEIDGVEHEFSEDEIRNNGYIYSYYSSSGTRFYGFNYNLKTKKITEEADYHDFEEDESRSVAPQNCIDWGKRVLVCKNCQYELVAEYRNGHSEFTYQEIFDDERDCEKGVTIQTYCGKCQELIQEKYVTSHYYAAKRVEVEIDDICPEHKFSISQCPCGDYFDFYTWDMNMPYEWIDNGYRYYCDDCGLEVYEETIYEAIAGETCQKTKIITYTIKKDGQTKYTFVTSDVCEMHSYEKYVVLMEGSKTCEDGVYVTRKCIRCGDVWNHYESRGSHEYGISEIIDLSSYGLQDVYFYVKKCACDPIADYSYYGNYTYGWNDYSYRHSYIDIDNEEYDVYTWDDSDLVVLTREYTTEPVDCISQKYLELKIGYNVTTKTCLKTENLYLDRYYNHTWKTTCELAPGSETCTEGVIAKTVCTECGKLLNQQSASVHIMYNIDNISLEQYGCKCGTVLALYNCACGISAYIDMNGKCDFDSTFLGYFEWKDGEKYEQYLYTCAVTDPTTCGFRYAEKYEEVSTEPCQYQVKRYVLLGCDENAEGGTKIYIGNYRYVYHENIQTDERICDDAPFANIPCLKKYQKTEYCLDCGEAIQTYSYQATHNMTKTVYKKEISKGRVLYSEYHCTDCEVGTYYLLKGDGNKSDYYSIYDQTGSYSYATYASYRGENYPTQYLSWYDDGSWTLEEHFASPLGKLTEDVMSEFLENLSADGLREELDTFKEELNYIMDATSISFPPDTYEWSQESVDACNELFATYLELLPNFMSGIDIEQLKGIEFVATEEMMARQKYTMLDVAIIQASYGFLCATYNVPYSEEVLCAFLLEDQWPDVAIVMNLFDDGCYDLIRTTTSSGNVSYDLEECCKYSRTNYTYVESTCTQFGLANACDVCVCCGRPTETYRSYIVSPKGHSWVKDGEYYRCSECGIENKVGANGSVVLEDCSSEYSDDIYTVGYYDPTGKDFQLNITLIMHDQTLPAEEQQVLVEGVTMTVTGLGMDGKPVYRYLEEGHYIYFSKTEVLSIAAKMGYTDPTAFDIRLSFVPINGGDSYDYGITFGDLQ